MQVRILSVFLLLSSLSLLFSTVVCNPNHLHNQNDFPWQNILSSLGIDIETKSSETSITQPSGDSSVGSKEHYTPESTVEILKSETKDASETPIVAQNGTLIENRITTSSYSSNEGLGLGFKIGIPIVSIVFFVLFWYCVCKCCCACCQTETPGVVVMQSNTVQNQPPAPQIILQQPIIHQQAPPMYDAQQKWAHPPPQWGQPPQGPPQWAPHPMGQQQHYSPNSGYDNAGYNPGNAPPPYNTGQY